MKKIIHKMLFYSFHKKCIIKEKGNTGVLVESIKTMNKFCVAKGGEFDCGEATPLLFIIHYSSFIQFYSLSDERDKTANAQGYDEGKPVKAHYHFFVAAFNRQCVSAAI